jgi:hypothetical protein
MTTDLIARAEKALQSEGRLADYHLCEIRRVDLQELLAALKAAEAERDRLRETLERIARTGCDSFLKSSSNCLAGMEARSVLAWEGALAAERSEG